ncbi:hypothetical protein ACFV8E_33420 [Streptomyces sp. NPDC059849]|uniref:hypothetical protein n=1 Tax=Streptomyces sp. NPDC059849 TaxID=3346969 RepID=UPI003661E9D1
MPGLVHQRMWKVGEAWDDHDLIFALDGYMPRKGGIAPGGPQDAGQVSARWRSTGTRLEGARKLASGTAQRIGLGRIE